MPPAAPTSRRSIGATRIILVLMVAAMLAGCGKKGFPAPPTDQPNTFPRPYPSH
jgi:hypothetical protein